MPQCITRGYLWMFFHHLLPLSLYRTAQHFLNRRTDLTEPGSIYTLVSIKHLIQSLVCHLLGGASMSGPGDETRQRLLEAAGEVFAAKGFQAATVREICSRAGANLAAINYHFGDKERLYVEAVRHAHSAGAEQPPHHWPSDTRPEEKLRQYIGHVLRNMLQVKKPAWHAQLMFREMFTPTAACVELVEADIRPRAEALNRIIDELVPGDTPSVDRHLIAFSVIGQCLFFNAGNRVAELLVGEDEFRSYDVDKLRDHITGFTLAALGHRRPHRSLSSEVTN